MAVTDNFPRLATAYVWTFFMAQTADGYTGITGLTPTLTVSLDGAAFGGITGAPAPTEIALGWYHATVPISDMASRTLLRAVGAGARDTFELIQPGTWIDELLGDRVQDDTDGTISVKQSDGSTESHKWTPSQPTTTTSKWARS